MAYLPRTNPEEIDPENWVRYAPTQGAQIQDLIAEQLVSAAVWLRKKSLPVALIGGLLFWGSLQIAAATHRDNAKSETLENLQIASVLNAQNGLAVAALGLGTFFYLRKHK